MEHFLKTYFTESENLKIKKLKGDGGHRSYFRIQDKEKSYVLMESGKGDQSLKTFIFWQNKMQGAGLPVPKIFKWDLGEGYLLSEDLGDILLESQFFNKEFYHQALKYLVLMQEKISVEEEGLLFDSSFLKEETQTALGRFSLFFKRKNLTFPFPSSFKKALFKICNQLDTLPFLFCHRDYHSRNLMIKEGFVRIIDFQDAGSGPYCYDLTSLLYDSYVRLPLKEKEELTLFYFKHLPAFLKKIVPDSKTLLHHAKTLFLQRGFKACGSFVSFDNENHKTEHLPFVKPTLLELEEVSKELSQNQVADFFKKLREAL